MPDAERSEEAMTLVLIIYGEFLQRSEAVLNHGVASIALRVVDRLRLSRKH